MKRIVLGDTHGHFDNVFDIINKENADVTILLGDYMDSFIIKPEAMASGMKKLLKKKRKLGDKLVLLMGNHDFHYIHPMERYSGYNRATQVSCGDILKDAFNKHEISVAYVDDVNHVIYSHAGISSTWRKENYPDCPLDQLSSININCFRFSHARFGDMYGESRYQGPLWIRPRTLANDLLEYGDDHEKWTQVVGHTVSMSGKPVILADGKVIVIDCMPFYYMRETIDDETGKITNVEFVEYKEFDSGYIQ